MRLPGPASAPSSRASSSRRTRTTSTRSTWACTATTAGFPVEETDIPGFATVTNRQALAFLGLVGGQHPDVDHPYIPFEVPSLTVTIVPGTLVEARFEELFEPEFPTVYAYTGAPNYPLWVTIEDDGRVSLAPPVTELEQTIELPFTVTDGLGRTADTTLTVKIDGGPLM